MKKLLLIYPAWCDAFGAMKKVAKNASSFPPLNLCVVAAVAERAGWDARLIDGEVENLDMGSILQQVGAYKPDLIGITATTPFFHTVCETARELKKHFDTPIVVGGAHISIEKEKCFLECFDYLIVDECELDFGAFLSAFEQGRPATDIKGVMFRSDDGEIVFSGPSQRIQNLDDAPLPLRRLLNKDAYWVGTIKGRKNYTSFQMSRGCPFECVFCASDLYGRAVRRRTLPHVMDELDQVVNGMGVKHLYFLDDTLTLNKKYIFELCDLIEGNGLKFTFEGGTRANLWDRDLAARMKECGLIRISFGLETADREVSKLLKKGVDLDSYVTANRINNQLKIETINSVMLGLPGENRERIKKTVDFLRNSKDIHHATYGIAMPYPGTEMLRMAQEEKHGLKLVETDFSKYQRYGHAVMEVNGIGQEELIQLQQEGLRKIYLRWWRIVPMLKRHGIRPLFLPALLSVKATVQRKLARHKTNSVRMDAAGK